MGAVDRLIPSAARLSGLLHRLGATADGAGLHAELATAWSEPHRVYHTIEHLTDCLRELDAASAEGGDATLAEAALWFHDAIYHPGAADNEARSATWAVRSLLSAGLAAEIAAEVARLVMLTGHLEPPPPGDATGALVCDVDLSILGRAPEAYDRFERRIRAEYAAVPEPLYRAERARILARLHRREPIYRTPHFRRLYEPAAHANLARALRGLGLG